MTTYSKLDDPDYLCVQIVELTAEVERLTAENQHLFDRANDVKAENERLQQFEQAVIAARSWLACCQNEPPDFERLKQMLVRPYEVTGKPVELFGEEQQAAEALAPDYFQRGLAAAPGLVLTGTEEQE